jgi:hypothetical protein
LQIDQFSVGTGVFTAPFSISVVNNGVVVGDAFVLQTGGSVPGVPAGTYDLVQLNLSDPTGGVLSSTALPTSLGLWPAQTITFQRFQVAAGGATGFLGATSYNLSRLELAPATTPVPEPATLILIGSGLAAGLRRRMRKAA